MKYLLVSLAVFSLLVVSLPSVIVLPTAQARVEINVNVSNPNSGTGASNPATGDLPEGHAYTLEDVTDIIRLITRWLIYISGTLAVFFIVLSGITYMYAGDDEGTVTKAKDMFKSGLIGSLIVFGVGTILWTVEGIVSGNFFGF
jgi:hypothetical protein